MMSFVYCLLFIRSSVYTYIQMTLSLKTPFEITTPLYKLAAKQAWGENPVIFDSTRQ